MKYINPQCNYLLPDEEPEELWEDEPDEYEDDPEEREEDPDEYEEPPEEELLDSDLEAPEYPDEDDLLYEPDEILPPLSALLLVGAEYCVPGPGRDITLL